MSSTGWNAEKTGRRIDLGGWIMVAWVAWWSWAYVQSAVFQRFPQLKIGAAPAASSKSYNLSSRALTSRLH